MGNDSFESLTLNLDKITMPFLGQIRLSKEINEKMKLELLEILKEIEIRTKNEDQIPKKLIGKLLFVFATVITECEYAKDSNQKSKLKTFAWEYEELLEKICGLEY
jgi:hypothetical protein